MLLCWDGILTGDFRDSNILVFGNWRYKIDKLEEQYSVKQQFQSMRENRTDNRMSFLFLRSFTKLCGAVPLFLALMLGTAASAFAQECVEKVDEQIMFRSGNQTHLVDRVVSFSAVIGERDLSNSKGKRLTDFRAIIRQDRANLHMSGLKDRFDTIEDSEEQYFTTPANRNLLTTAHYYDYCNMSEQDIDRQRNDIVAGQVAGSVWVIIFRHPDSELAVFASIAG